MIPNKSRFFLLLLTLGCLVQGQQAEDDTAQKPAAQSNTKSSTAKNTKDDKATPRPEAPTAVTHHQITLSGQTLKYTATAGRMAIDNEEGKTEARMFYVAYILDGGAARRPLTFAFNGGPGSATIWLHMGAFGPKRVKLQNNGFMPAPPFELEDNPATWLASSDLVFVDAVGTGYSRPETPDLGKKFWSVSGDIAAFGEFIRLYLQTNSRWTSPLFLAGESYGTTRAAGLSGWLVDHGIALNGVVLISTILQFQTASFTNGNDLPYVMYLPTYALTAAYHHKLSPELEADPGKLRDEVEKWASHDYLLALQQGDSLPDSERRQIADRLAKYTGLTAEYILRCNLRVDLSRFDTDLLRSQGRMVGRLDGRFTGPEEQSTEQDPDFDPSEAGIRPPFTSVFGNYIRQELKYETNLPYHVLGEGLKSWDFQTTGWSGFTDTSTALRKAFAKNPYMRVFVAEGIYDAATPYYAVDYTLEHMNLPPESHKNISRDRFETGHMVYIDSKASMQLKADVERLYSQAVAHPST